MTTIYLPDYRHKFSSDNYYKSCKAIINKINGHFGFVMDYLPVSEYETLHDDIVQVLLDNYTIRNNDQLSSKMGHIYGAMKVSGYSGSFMNKGMKLQLVPIEPQPLVKDVPLWIDMLGLIKKAIALTPHTGGFVLGTTYFHGYVLRCGEIANTCTIEHSKYNFLDCVNKKWHIRADLTKNRRARTFSVSQAYLDEIAPYIKKTGFLISKKNGQPYKGNFTLATVTLCGFTVNDVRNSYETMSYNREDINEEEKNLISENVLGHCPAVARAYYTPPIVVK
jgi:hypothetical protein